MLNRKVHCFWQSFWNEINQAHKKNTSLVRLYDKTLSHESEKIDETVAPVSTDLLELLKKMTTNEK